MDAHRTSMVSMLLDKARNLDESISYLDCYMAECDSCPDWLASHHTALKQERDQAWSNYYRLVK